MMLTYEQETIIVVAASDWSAINEILTHSGANMGTAGEENLVLQHSLDSLDGITTNKVLERRYTLLST
ncbi:unnamed protein product [Urochloa humidicola]